MSLPSDKNESGVNDPHEKILRMDPKGGSHSYPDIPKDVPADSPGLTGGPATEAVPGTHRVDPLDPTGQSKRPLVAPLSGDDDDGGEGLLSGRPRETGGERPDSED